AIDIPIVGAVPSTRCDGSTNQEIEMGRKQRASVPRRTFSLSYLAHSSPGRNRCSGLPNSKSFLSPTPLGSRATLIARRETANVDRIRNAGTREPKPTEAAPGKVTTNRRDRAGDRRHHEDSVHHTR